LEKTQILVGIDKRKYQPTGSIEASAIKFISPYKRFY